MQNAEGMGRGVCTATTRLKSYTLRCVLMGCLVLVSTLPVVFGPLFHNFYEYF